MPVRTREGVLGGGCGDERCASCYIEVSDHEVVEEQRRAAEYIEDYAAMPEINEDPEPRCDICNDTMESSLAEDWNGETGNHLSCEHNRRMTLNAVRIRARIVPEQSFTQEVPSLEELTPIMPEINLTDESVELVHCAYVERTCLRRDRDGNVPATDENGRRQTEYCDECGENYCITHRHTSQRRAENYCEGHQRYHARCVMTTECPECNHRFCPDEEHTAGGDMCDEWLDREDVEFENDGSGNGYYNGPWREAELLFEGDTPVEGLATGKRYVAFELEEEVRPGGSARFTLPEKFGITSDGSLRNGVEVTFPPSRMDALVENVRMATDALQRGGFGPTARCGMHTHIDLRDKVNDHTFLSRLFATFYAVEDVLFAMQSANRVTNSYCTPLRNGWQFYDAYGKNAADFDFVFYKEPKSLASKLRIEEMKKRKGGNRYNAFNFLSVWYRGSLEIRLHEGCINPRKMLMWAELLNYIIQRVEDGITYPTLRKLLDMPVGPDKLALFGRVFRLPDPLLNHVQERITEAQGGIHYRMPGRVRLGTPVKGRSKSLLPSRTFKPTHRRCRWCGAVIAMARRCSYCRRAPMFERDEYGMADERVMYLRGGRDEYGRNARTAMSEHEFNTITGQVAALGAR